MHPSNHVFESSGIDNDNMGFLWRLAVGFYGGQRLVSQDGGPFSSSDNFGLICHINHAKNLLFITNDGGKG